MMTDTPTPTAPETDELEKLLAKANELLAASTELAELASYAEIVGGIHVNRPHIRKWCDRVFEIRKTLPEDENYEPAFPAADLIRLRAEVATLRASEARMREALAKNTSGNERVLHSRTGHSLAESSWHVHLAGFCSRSEAEEALAALQGETK